MDKEEGIPLPKSKKYEGGFVGVLKRRLPVLEWAPRYSRTRALADAIAGVTLGLTLVPQSIAYASLANLPMQYGLYSSFIGTMLYVVLGTVKEVSIGPTSLMALLTLHTCRDLPIDYVFLLTFLSGCVVLLMGLLQLGFLVDLISPSVTSGFTSGTAVIIVVAQIKGLLGLSFVAESIWDNAHFIAMKWHEVRLGDCLLSGVCCTVLLSLRKLKDVKVNPKRPKLKWSLWLISISRNAIVVCAAALFAFGTHDPHQPLFKLSGRVEPGLPPLSLPPFSSHEGDETVGFTEMVRRLGAGVVLLPLVMVLSNISIAKAFSSEKRVDATQEMLTLGLVNVAGAFVHAMPTCGAFTRSAVSHSSGVRSPAAGLYSGIITLLALSFMMPYFYFIPKACLSSVLICAVIFMVDISTVRTLWYRNKYELFVVGTTFGVSVLWSVELAVLAGVLTSLALLLRQLMRPAIHLHTIRTDGAEVIVAKPAMALLYLNAERFLMRLQRTLSTLPHPPPVLIDCGDLSAVDYHAGQVLEKLAQKLKCSDQQLILYNAFNKALRTLQKLDHIERRALIATSVMEALDMIKVKMMEREETTPLLTGGQEKQDI